MSAALVGVVEPAHPQSLSTSPVMRHARCLLAMLLAGCCPPSTLVSSPSAAPSDGSLSAVAWLAGTWLSDDEQTEEHWSPPRGGTMMGHGRTVVGGQTRHYEHLRLEAKGTEIVYHASPAGQPAASFSLVEEGVEQADARLIFDNPAHDYPQRIIYERVAPGQLRMRIEGVADGAPKSSSWQMRRTELPACPR